MTFYLFAAVWILMGLWARHVAMTKGLDKDKWMGIGIVLGPIGVLAAYLADSQVPSRPD